MSLLSKVKRYFVEPSAAEAIVGLSQAYDVDMSQIVKEAMRFYSEKVGTSDDCFALNELIQFVQNGDHHDHLTQCKQCGSVHERLLSAMPSETQRWEDINAIMKAASDDVQENVLQGTDIKEDKLNKALGQILEIEANRLHLGPRSRARNERIVLLERSKDKLKQKIDTIYEKKRAELARPI